MLRRHTALLGSVVASLAAVAMTAAGCAQVLGIDDRSVADGGQSDGTTKPDGRTKDAASHVDGKSGTDATVKPDGGTHVDAADGGHPADHHVADVGTNGDSASDGSTPGDASDASDATLTACDGGAFNVETDPNHCGTCTNACPSAAAGVHNEEPTCASGVCGLACDPGYGNCDDAGSGCTYDLSILPSNCGACGSVCGNSNTSAAATCASGACVFQCDPGFAHCNTIDADGCETNIGSDSNNCGYCGYNCGTGVECVQGFCRLTTAAAFSQQLGLSALVQDSTTAAGGSLYWVVDSTPRVIQTVHKDGSSLGPVTTTNPPNTQGGSSLSVDGNNVYYFSSVGPALDEVSTAGTTGTNIRVPGFTSSSGPPQGVICDGDLTHPSTTVFFAQAGSGVYRVTLTGTTPTQYYLADAWPVQGMALWDKTLYYTAGQPNGTTYLEYVTTTQTTTSMPALDTFTGGATAVATDGVNVYVMGYTPNVITVVPIGGGINTTLATNSAGAGQGNLATDGKNVYISTNNLYRVPVTATNVDLSTATPIFSASAFLENTITGVVVDDVNIYVSTAESIYKTKK